MPITWRRAQVEIPLDSKNIAALPLEIISNIRERFDFCIDQNGVDLLTEDEKLWGAIRDLKNKGIKVRFVTALSDRNISFYRQLMKCGEVFHNDRVKGNFQLADGTDYLCYISENGDPTEGKQQQQQLQLFHANTKSFVDVQQYLFDNLCNNSTPAKERIKEIGRGVRTDFTDTINEPGEITKTLNNLLSSSRDEILLLFSTSNSFYRAKHSGMLNSLRQVSNDVTVKALTLPSEDITKEAIQEELKRSHLQIHVQYIAKSLQSNIMIVVVDQATSIAVEVKDDSNKTFKDASATAIYSNSELTVSSCISIFETLWIESELDKQEKIKHAYFQMFKGLELKDESYSRRWSFQQEKEK
jgi:two-component system, OmpR family, sensor histidine kinase VicK